MINIPERYTRQPDRQTDRQTIYDSNTALCVASRGKKSWSWSWQKSLYLHHCSLERADNITWLQQPRPSLHNIGLTVKNEAHSCSQLPSTEYAVILFISDGSRFKACPHLFPKPATLLQPKRQQSRLFPETKSPFLATQSPETATKSPVSEQVWAGLL